MKDDNDPDVKRYIKSKEIIPIIIKQSGKIELAKDLLNGLIE